MTQSPDRPVPRKMGLGRGLDALLGEAIRERPPVPAEPAGIALAANNANADIMATPDAAKNGLAMINVADIKPNPVQPRRYFNDEAINELAQSLTRHGVIQPIVVRPYANSYQIVAGERRWRAAQRAQIHIIPAIIRDFNDGETLEIALIENIQRQDLNPIEEAEAYRKLSDEFGHSQAALAEIVEKSRSHVANMMRLLDLPLPLRDLVVEGRLQMGHARALLGSDQAVELAAIVVKRGLSVRATEALVRNSKSKAQNSAGGDMMKDGKKISSDADADIRAVETHLGDLLGLKVSIHQQGSSGSGSVTFQYGTLDQLDMLCQRLTGEKF